MLSSVLSRREFTTQCELGTHPKNSRAWRIGAWLLLLISTLLHYAVIPSHYFPPLVYRSLLDGSKTAHRYTSHLTALIPISFLSWVTQWRKNPLFCTAATNPLGFNFSFVFGQVHWTWLHAIQNMTFYLYRLDFYLHCVRTTSKKKKQFYSKRLLHCPVL